MNMIKDGGCCYDNIKQHCTDLTEQATAGLFYWTRAFFVASDVVGSHGRHLRGVGLKNDYLWVATSRNWIKSHRQFNWHAWSTNCINNQGGFETAGLDLYRVIHCAERISPFCQYLASSAMVYISTSGIRKYHLHFFWHVHCVNF